MKNSYTILLTMPSSGRIKRASEVDVEVGLKIRFVRTRSVLFRHSAGFSKDFHPSGSFPISDRVGRRTSVIDGPGAEGTAQASPACLKGASGRELTGAGATVAHDRR